jgi:hypothetical protein
MTRGSPSGIRTIESSGMWTQAKSPLGYRCPACDTDLPVTSAETTSAQVTGADHGLSVLTCPNCGSACDLDGSAPRRGNARPAKKVVSTGMRAVMFPFT